MALTNAQAQADYLAAREALNETAHSLTAPQGAVDEAREKVKRLNLRFVGSNIAAIEALTAQYRQFIAELSDYLDKIGHNEALDGVKKITTIVARAGDAVGSLGGGGGGGDGGATG